MILTRMLAYLTRESCVFVRSVQTALWIIQGDTSGRAGWE